MVRIDRRRFLKAVGLGALSTVAGRVAARGPSSSTLPVVPLTDPAAPPTRIVFYLTPHGHTPLGWNMPIPNGPTTAFAERSLLPLAPTDFSPILQPLYPFRDRTLVVEGLSHTSALANIAQVMQTGGDLNNHSVGVANALTGTTALQVPGSPCTGGARVRSTRSSRSAPSRRAALGRASTGSTTCRTRPSRRSRSSGLGRRRRTSPILRRPSPI